MSFRSVFGIRPRFPVSPQHLPVGVATFLRHIPAHGSVFNHHNTGGYLEWMLYPQYNIFMDMQCPLLFTEEDLFTTQHAFHNDAVLRRVVEDYDPAFITIPIWIGQSQDVIRKFPEYVPVFFDEVEVLYLNQRQYPAIARDYQLTTLDPFTLATDMVSVLNRDDRQALVRESRRLLDIYPDGLMPNQLLAALFNAEGAYDRALAYAEAIIKAFPELSTGYALKGDALKGLKAFERALASYQKALKRSQGERRDIHRAMGFVYRALGQYRKAYRAFNKAGNPFVDQMTYQDLYDLGSTALLAGKTREGAMFLRFAAQKAPPEDPAWFEHLKNLEEPLRQIRVE
jgi:tetratricopeptide (TPR) repeat protein